MLNKNRAKRDILMNKSDVIKHFGNATKVADALGISQAAVSQWGKKVPDLRAFQLERITNGALVAEQPASSQQAA